MQKTNLDFLWQYIPAFEEIFSEGAPRGHEICGPGEEVRLLFGVSAVKDKGKTVLWIAETEEKAKKIRQAAHGFLPAEALAFTPVVTCFPMNPWQGTTVRKLNVSACWKGSAMKSPSLP